MKYKNPDPKSALRHFFAARRDLDARYPDKDDLTYKIFRNGLTERLSEDNYRALLALDAAFDMLVSKRGISKEQSAALEHLKKYEPSRYTSWSDDFQERNVEQVALGILDLWAVTDFGDIPSPSQESIEKWEAAYNHRITRAAPAQTGDEGPPRPRRPRPGRTDAWGAPG